MERVQFNVQELSLEDQQNIEGGFFMGLVVLLATTMAADAILDTGESAKAIANGYNKQKNVQARQW